MAAGDRRCSERCRCWRIRSTVAPSGLGGVGLIACAAGVAGSRGPLAGLLLALPALAATGLIEDAHPSTVSCRTGSIAGYDAVRERVPRLLGEPAPRGGADRPARAGAGAGFGGAGGQDDPPQDRAARRGGRAGDGSRRWPAATAGRPERAAVPTSTGSARLQGTADRENPCAQVEVPRPATVETWVASRGDPLLVVMAEPAASLARSCAG